MSISEETTISSCLECPNFTRDTLSDGRGFGSCKVYGKAVYVGGVSPSGHAVNLASTCKYAGKETTEPFEGPFKLFPPCGTATTGLSDEVGNCRACVNFRVSFRNGALEPLAADLCAATGSKVDADFSYKGCGSAVKGIFDPTPVTLNSVVFSASELNYMEPHGEATTTTAAPSTAKAPPAVAKRRRSKLIDFDPLTYSTDMELREADKGKIRAWRLIEVGEGTKRKGVYLPIYDPEFFTSGQRETIPQAGDDESPELYHDGSGILEAFVISAWLKGQALCFVGEPGVGKTEGARWLAWLMQLPFTHLQVTEETLPDEFLGTPGFDPELGTYFKWGRLPKAITPPGIVLSDEINLGQPAIVQTYRALNGDSATIFLEGEESEKHIVKKNKDCFHLLSLNPAYDARNLGAAELADADVRRMSYKYVEEPSEAVVKDIIVSKLAARGVEILADELDAMMKVRKDLKAMASTGELPYSWSIAQDVKVAMNLEYLNGPSAYKRALLDYCSPDVAEMALKAVQSHFGFATD